MILPHMAEKYNWSRLSAVANPSLRPSSISAELFMLQSGVYTYALVQSLGLQLVRGAVICANYPVIDISQRQQRHEPSN
jgi:hypothetical protein